MAATGAVAVGPAALRRAAPMEATAGARGEALPTAGKVALYATCAGGRATVYQGRWSLRGRCRPAGNRLHSGSAGC